MAVDQLTFAGKLVTYQCWCGMWFGLPESLLRVYEDRSHHSLYCPLGHSMIPKAGYSKAELLQQSRVREQALHDQLAASERSKAALRGHLTRLRNRLINGVCPWCNRHFSQVQRHVATQHPDRIERMDEALHG